MADDRPNGIRVLLRLQPDWGYYAGQRFRIFHLHAQTRWLQYREIYGATRFLGTPGGIYRLAWLIRLSRNVGENWQARARRHPELRQVVAQWHRIVIFLFILSRETRARLRRSTARHRPENLVVPEYGNTFRFITLT